MGFQMGRDKPAFNLSRCWHSFVFACCGLGQLWQQELNFRIHLAITIVVIALGSYLKLPPIEWTIITLTIGGMLTTEGLNTAVERTVDLACKGKPHPIAKQAKDIAAASCLIMATVSVIIGAIIFLPKLVVRFFA
jgi:undecaprenol kinase